MSEQMPATETPDRERKVLCAALKRCYRTLEELEAELREARQALPQRHRVRVKLLALETLCGIRLIPKRRAMEDLARRLEAAGRPDP
jgi:hypothetical protein